MIDANRMYQEALKIGTALWPRAPECLLSPTSVYDFSIERDITGAGYGKNCRLRTAESARAELSSFMRRRKVTMEIEERRSRLRAQIEAADAYEAACAHANKVSCFPQAEYLRKEMTDVLFACVAKIQAEPAYTMAGIRLKAKALRAWEHAPLWRRMVNLHGSDQWAPNLARTLLETLDA